MGATTANQAYPYPLGTDVPNVPSWIQQLALFSESRGVMRFTSTATRDSKVPSPAAGMLAWCDSPGALFLFRSGAWRLVAPQVGGLSITLAAGVATGTVVFPVAFASTPQVSPWIGAITGNTPAVLCITGISTTQFQWRAMGVTGANNGSNYSGTIAGGWIASEG